MSTAERGASIAAIAGLAALVFVGDSVLALFGRTTPIGVLAGAGVALAAAVEWRLRSLPRRARHAIAAGVLLATLCLHVWPWGPRKSFLEAVSCVEIGMTRAEVAALFSDFETGHPYGIALFDAPDRLLFHHGRGGTFQSRDFVTVAFDESGGARSVVVDLD